MEDLKCYLNAKISKQEEKLKNVFNNSLNNLLKGITKQIKNEIKSHCEHFESENQMSRHQVSELRRLNISNQNNHEELEQFGRRLSIRIDCSKWSDDVLDSVKSLFKEAEVDIPESVIDHTHKIGCRCLDVSSNNYCKNIIIPFSKFCHRTMSYESQK